MGEGDYKPGDEAIYYDSEEILRVEVLENRSDDEQIGYLLRVDKVSHRREKGISLRAGDEFECEKKRGVARPGLWHLVDED